MTEHQKTVTELGQDLLDAAYDVHNHELENAELLALARAAEKKNPVETLLGLKSEAAMKLEDMIANGGASMIVEIASTGIRLQEAFKEARGKYLDARHTAELAESAQMHADAEEARTNVESYINRKFGQRDENDDDIAPEAGDFRDGTEDENTGGF